MKVGIVGKPNVGKSSFFRSLSLAKAEAANYPFTTIDANTGIGFIKVEDPAAEFGKKSDPREGYVQGSYRFVAVELVDVAGLVPDAHQGKGLGNKFLDDLRQADVLIHVIDLSGSTNEKGEPVALNSYNPAYDVEFLEEELNHWFSNVISRNFENIKKKIQYQDVKLKESLARVLSGLKITEEQIERALLELELDTDNIGDNIFELSKRLRELSKPIIIAANKADVLVSEKWKEKLENLRSEKPREEIVPIMAEYELNLKLAHQEGIVDYLPGEGTFSIQQEGNLSEKQKAGLEKIKEALEEVGTTGVQDVLNKAVLEVLGYKAIFPGGTGKLEDKEGNVLPDCFLMPPDTTVLGFAYKLHTDFGKNFIRALDVRSKLPVSKDYVLKHRDIVELICGK